MPLHPLFDTITRAHGLVPPQAESAIDDLTEIEVDLRDPEVEHVDERDFNTDPEEVVEFFGYRKVVACIDRTGGRFRGF